MEYVPCPGPVLGTRDASSEPKRQGPIPQVVHSVGREDRQQLEKLTCYALLILNALGAGSCTKTKSEQWLERGESKLL